jgi:hypothetical protein
LLWVREFAIKSRFNDGIFGVRELGPDDFKFIIIEALRGWERSAIVSAKKKNSRRSLCEINANMLRNVVFFNRVLKKFLKSWLEEYFKKELPGQVVKSFIY